MARGGFSPGDLALRLAIGVALVLGTWNPSGASFAGWALGPAAEGRAPLVALAGVTLAILWAIYLRATYRAIGPFGAALAAAFVGALVWTLVWAGVLDLSDGSARTWVGLVGLGLVLGIGLSWSHVRRVLTGQADVDDVSER